MFSALHCGAGEGSSLPAVPPLLWGSDCTNQNIQEAHRAACAPHQHISQQYSYFTPSSFNCWDLSVHGGRVEQRGLKSMLNTLDRIFKVCWLIVQTFSTNKRENQAPPESTYPALQQWGQHNRDDVHSNTRSLSLSTPYEYFLDYQLKFIELASGWIKLHKINLKYISPWEILHCSKGHRSILSNAADKKFLQNIKKL